MVALLIAAGCGDDSTDSSTKSSGGSAATSGDKALSPLEKVYAAVDNLSGQARFDKLLEMAKAEGGKVVVYTSDIEPVNNAHKEGWKKDTGLDMEIFRDTAVANLERLLKEKAAGKVNADTVLLNPATMWPAVNEGLCAPLPKHLPSADGMIDGAVQKDWVISQLALYMPIWNTDRVSKDNVPTSWETILDGHYGNKLGIEQNAWDSFAWVIERIEKDKGVSEQKAIDMIKRGFEGARLTNGHGPLEGLLNTGEIDVAIQYPSVADPDIAKGAHISYKPPVTPIPAQGVGLCILDGVAHPATALLYLDWRITTGMKLAYEVSNLPGTNPKYTPSAGTTVGAKEGDVEIIPKEIYTNQTKWQGVMNDLVASAG